uniref:Ig-like domain-containing protein n=1 Tax=Naja naja TaxID=35670 RepID=A0A8C7E402_NAJNA
LLGATFSTRAEKLNVAAGTSVFLHCRSKTDNDPPLIIWNYNGKLLLKKMNGKIFKGKTDMSLCRHGRENLPVGLLSFTVTGSKSGYLLQGDTLKLHLSPVKDARIEWFEPRKTKVTGNEPRWKLQKDSLQILNLTVQEDNGIWECHIFPYNVNISYNVKVLGFFYSEKAAMHTILIICYFLFWLDIKPGFSNLLDEFQFATFNSSISLSCALNIDQQEKSDQEIPKVQSWKWLKNNILVKDHNISNINRSIQQISNVHSEDAGQYQCHIGFKHGILIKTINLIVVKVSAIPPMLKSKENNVTLCGHISPSAPPLTELCWVYVNESTSQPKCGSPISENKFCHVATTEGLWRCDLKVNNDVKISIDYVLGKFQEKNLSFIFWQQQAKRMAQIKQHLLAKRTCQCQR